MDDDTLKSARQLIRMALAEDLGDVGDLTSQATIAPDVTATAEVVSRAYGVVCGVPLISEVFLLLEDKVCVSHGCQDGDAVAPGTCVASLTGAVRTLLTGERTVLNLMTHLSGIATRTAEFRDCVVGTSARILDTRKTLPGYRLLQKYAVRCGGGSNHRMGLHDGILIKDNHLAARGNLQVAAAVRDARQFLQGRGDELPVEVEVDTLEQLRDALREFPEIVLLDNMSPEMLIQAVQIRNQTSPTTLLEASGGVTLETVRGIAETGVDRISIGSLTHSSPALDLAFDWAWQRDG